MAWVGFHLDHGRAQHLISAAAVAVGVLVCLPTGFFKSPWSFLPYTAVVAAASTVPSSGHARHLGLLVRGLAGTSVLRFQFQARRCRRHNFHLRDVWRSDRSTSLWVVSIFASLVWLAGVYHALGICRPGVSPEQGKTTWKHAAELFSYPDAAFDLAGTVLVSFATSCIFAGSLLHLVGVLCYKPVDICRSGWPTSRPPLLSLSLLHLLSLLIRSEALRVQLISLLATAGAGFFYCHLGWHAGHILAAAAAQSTAAGSLHACCRVLVMDCLPQARKGAFAARLAWGRTAGAGHVREVYVKAEVWEEGRVQL